MEATLFRAQAAYPDCSAMASKLRAMTSNTEEQLRAQQKQASYLTQVVARTMPKGLHCFSLSLISEYFQMDAEKRVLPRGHLVEDPDLYHYAVFSDNVLACSVVVNSTICNSKVLASVFILSIPNWYQSVFVLFIFSWDLVFWIKLQPYMGAG